MLEGKDKNVTPGSVRKSKANQQFCLTGWLKLWCLNQSVSSMLRLLIPPESELKQWFHTAFNIVLYYPAMTVPNGQNLL